MANNSLLNRMDYNSGGAIGNATSETLSLGNLFDRGNSGSDSAIWLSEIQNCLKAGCMTNTNEDTDGRWEPSQDGNPFQSANAEVNNQSNPFDQIAANAMGADRSIHGRQVAAYRAYKRRQFRTSAILFVLTLCSTFLVGSNFVPLTWLTIKASPEVVQEMEREILKRSLETGVPPQTVNEVLWDSVLSGLAYSVALMTILFCHEMGHYLQSVRYHVPASFPYFIPLPLPPLGTMGAVILQGRGVATRRQMFDIAVSGPIAGLVVTIPVLLLGIMQSEYQAAPTGPSLEFGEPLLLQWLIQGIHGAGLPGQSFYLTSLGMAGWVGVFITAMNLLPVGQLDGGHILYTLIGRPAHAVAIMVVVAGVAMMAYMGNFTFSLLMILLILTGLRHPPTADDSEPLGKGRMLIGWLTLSFLIIGFTPSPIAQTTGPQDQPPAEQIEPVEANYAAVKPA